MIPDWLEPVIDAAVPNGVTHIGFVSTNISGAFLITAPKGSPYGVSATFNKIKVQKGEPPSRTLTRCINEQLGQTPDSFYPVPTTWVTPNSTSFYFAGLFIDDVEMRSQDGSLLQWCEFDRAEELLKASKSQSSRQRDTALLKTVSEMCLSPYRRMLHMLRELHKMGFERLRAPAYDYPLAWRCPVVPAAWTSRVHGGEFNDPTSALAKILGEKRYYHVYSSADGQRPYGWEDMAFATPRELALRFLKEHRDIAVCGWGPDAAYMQWFEEVLEATEPNGLYSAFAEFISPPEGFLMTHHTSADRVPVPPPGLALPKEFSHFEHMLEQKQKASHSTT